LEENTCKRNSEQGTNYLPFVEKKHGTNYLPLIVKQEEELEFTDVKHKFDKYRDVTTDKNVHFYCTCAPATVSYLFYSI